MQAMKCDRCGKFYEFYLGQDRDDSENSNAVILIDRDWTRNKYSETKYLDLCPECMEELGKFLRSKDNGSV